ncbi:MAG: CDP-diacylglycerol--glycerol-3-phosphate 3-phosphatidyltransferase [Alphaproteobacteria bacterium]|nr:CDP-diacylglycerol--glycerol-3-phosphate 3-phosphatidyltransferase [Alphaproteobacteria bacterium]
MITSLPNLLTLSRIAAIPVLALLFLLPAPAGPWLALAVFVAAGITDYLDGHIARTRQLQSSLGRMLDPIADKLFVAAVIFVLVAADRVTGVHIVAAAVILCREIVVSGLREFLADLRVGLPVSRLSKWKTAVQMVAMGVLLIAPASPFGLSLDGLGLGLLWIAAALTVATGLGYLRVGLSHATGRATRGGDGARP